ncbi:bifunctional isocitrate dehydrogenase kinase/phosphatase [Mongoliitalea daihaiensis]|uniref:bifunctional isocitrate dehydrogenase kinase/phosphatase n=1 Tax=Mongoliitalea daihaiensis TaxID=2782006 RepID=UPI001F3F9518|nr:bifunctional isocitrate dehydrogenase kinase/phosphatase [Mongoliitalea daihaiensis]UJP63942.1 bifunctional isocitrate dehydrogenase kinase/phosphatase [Mongoliitalea daihaiensis]
MRFYLNFNRLTIFLLSAFAMSCSTDTKQGEVAIDEVLIIDEELEQLFQTGIQLLSPWESFWNNQFSEFQVTQFTLDKTEYFEELEWPEENFITPGNPFHPYLIPHPEGDGIVDIYSYKVTIPAEGKPGLNPDSEVIYFKSNGMRKRLLFIGPSGGFEEAAWISTDVLMVAGWFEDEAGVSPVIWMIEPEQNRYKVFTHPFHSNQYPKDAYLKRKLTKIDL